MSFEDDVRREIGRIREQDGRGEDESLILVIGSREWRRKVLIVRVAVPCMPMSRKGMLSAVGRVNAGEFAGCDPGSLLISGFESDRPDGTGPRHTISFDWLQDGTWNDFLPSDSRFQRAYPEIDFREIEA